MKKIFAFFLIYSYLHSNTFDLEKYLNQKYTFKKNKYNILEDYSIYKQENLKIYIYLNEKLQSNQRKLIEDTLYLQTFMIGTIGFLVLLPESITKWDVSELDKKPLHERYKENVKAGPVWDSDEWAVNYIGHPVSGAWYYMTARSRGISKEGSFLYSFIMSTFFWEYGYEAFAEIPSIQDLITTPVFGSLLGEYFFKLDNDIKKNKGEVLGSKILGDISSFLLNPIGNLTQSLSDYFDLHANVYYKAYFPDYLKINPNLRTNQLHDYIPSSYGFVIDIDF